MERLSRLGIAQDYVDRQERGLVSYLEDNEVDMAEVVTAIFPTDEDVGECLLYVEPEPTLRKIFQESMVWLKWLMFKGDPGTALATLSQLKAGEHGVCRAVFGHNDIAYRCRTCEQDPSCRLCIPCFENGDHRNHDYLLRPINGGCCDCGDVTAWKHNGFCFKHKGTEHIQPLPSEFTNSMGAILDSLICFWRNRLVPLQSVSEHSPAQDHITHQFQEKLTSGVIELLLEFCGYSEGFYSFLSEKVLSLHGLMEILVRVELFFCSRVVEPLHELLLKLLGEPQFKHEFSIVFLGYYPTVVAEAIKESSDVILEIFPQLKTFSVQIFEVPTLALQLVKELNLLSVLFGCLEDMFISCAGYDGRLETLKWEGLFNLTIHVFEDIQFVMSHSAVPIYVTHECQDMIRRWMRILNFVQGMYPQKRETFEHIYQEKQKMEMPSQLGYCLAIIHSYLVGGAFSDVSSEEVESAEEPDSVRQAKIGRISQECSVSSLNGRNLISEVAESKRDYISIPTSVFWLTFECLRTIDTWLVSDNSLSRLSSSSSSDEVLEMQNSITSRLSMFNLDSGPGKYLEKEAGGSGSDEISTDTECSTELEPLSFLSSSEWPDHILYDVSLHEISTQIPLHRLLSMVLQRSLKKWCDESEFLNDCSATSGGLSSTTLEDLFSSILGSCHPCGFSGFIMEHPLRIKVFYAQVQAGMWLRNGDAPTISYGWYYLPRCSEKGLEPDLFLLQCCAALAPPNLYVKRILERYDLSEYLELNLERSSEYEPFLAQDMLTLIIQIVKERRFCGLTSAECLRRELIYKLSVGNATHSELVDFIPLDLLQNGDLQQILDYVAVYSSPFGSNKGVYQLRLECWKELDLYHPRCNSTDLQIIEERYFRFCNISAFNAQLPVWSKIYQPLSCIARIATCKTTLQVVRAVLFYAAFSEESMVSRAPEGMLLTAMHLLSLALNICSLQQASSQIFPNDDEVIPILKFASEDISSSRQQSLLSLLANLMKSHEKKKIESFDETRGHSNISSLCGNILKKFAELEPKCSIKLQKIAPEVVNQLSECSSDLDGSIMFGLAFDSEKCKAKARERQAILLEKMRAQQSKFLEIIKSTEDQEVNVSECGKDLVDNEVLYASRDSEEVICSLCHETSSKIPLCFLIHIQKSRLLSFLDSGAVSWEHSSQSKGDHLSPRKSAQSSNSTKSRAYDVFAPPDCDGVHLSSCGHAVHECCLERYLLSLGDRYVNGSITFEGWDDTEVPEKGEFICPACRGLANSVMPTLPRESEKVPRPHIFTNVTALESGTFSSTEVDFLRIQQAVSLMESAAFVGGNEPLQQSERQKSNLNSLFRVLCGIYFPSKAKIIESSLLLWDMLKYSIASTEIAARSGKLFSAATDGSDSINNELNSSTGIILSLLLNIAQGSGTENIHTPFLKFRGIQLFAESLCLGSSNVQQNRLEGLLEMSDCEAKWLDGQFWKRASDPVLAHDPFSSLMWLLFCLPNSFLSCQESFFCLVHIFYLVTITQVIVVIICRKQGCSLTQLRLEDCLITDICKFIRDCGITFKYLDSSHIDSCQDIKDVIRSMSAPFLRRCSLLWGLVNSSASVPFSQGNHVCYESSDRDILEVKRLELMFNIPPIDMIINDDMSCLLATRWLRHLSYEFKSQGHNVLYCTPSAPFSLMVLPNLYEHLIQWCNKQRCPDCEAVIKQPAVCLLCGKLCEAHLEAGCRRNKCLPHAMACGAGTGVFLLLWICLIGLIRGGRWAVWPSPYLDAKGDEDFDLTRGRPLYLNKERYAALTLMVASHSLHQSSWVLLSEHLI